MVKVKICGLRRNMDICFVNKYAPDYAGFVFAKGRRQVSPVEARKLAKALHGFIKKVGIFVNAGVEEMVRTAEECTLDAIQVHGDESPEYIQQLKGMLDPGIEVWKAVRVKDENSIKEMAAFQADRYVLDSYSEVTYGGSGKAFDWNLAVKAKKYGSIILAGGLNLQNIREAISSVKPFMVDVSSGVETDGWKDESKIRDFIYSVRCNTN